MPQSNRKKNPKKAKKPRPDFPLFPHATGRWAKKVRGKFHYFGKTANDPNGKAALDLWLDQKDALLAGRTPRNDQDNLSLRELCNRFLTAKEAQRDAGDIVSKTFSDYHSTCEKLLKKFGKDRMVDDLASGDFVELRRSLSSKLGLHALGREVQQTRTIFKYAFDSALIDQPMRFGPTFKKPSKRLLRAHKQKGGEKLFEAADLRKLISEASQPLKAMILLGINCGFGNADCGALPRSAMNLQRGWIYFPRPKTAVERECPLWEETVKALQEATKLRPKAKVRENGGLVFLTKYGQPWAKQTSDNPVTKEFRKLLDETKLHRNGLGFYALRHTFATVAGGSLDQVAVNHIMGHADNSMAAHYREKIEDKRLIAVTNHVHSWLFGDSG